MAKGIYAVVGGATKKGKKAYVVVAGLTKKVKKIYTIVGGITKITWTSNNPSYAIPSGASDGLGPILYETENGATLTARTAKINFRDSSAPSVMTIIDNTLYIGATGGLFKISLSDFTVTQTTPLNDRINGYSTYQNYTDIKRLNGKLFACVNSAYSSDTDMGSYIIHSSDNGVTWTDKKLYSYETANSWVEYSNGYYYVLTSERRLYTSSDLVNWTSTSPIGTSYSVYGMVKFNNRLVIAMSSGTKTILKYSQLNPAGALTYTDTTVASSGRSLHCPKVIGDKLYLITSTGAGGIFICTDVAGPFTGATLDVVSKRIDYNNGIYFIGTKDGLLYGTALTSLTLNTLASGITDITHKED